MYKLNFIAIVSIVAAVTLIVGLAAPASAQQNMTSPPSTLNANTSNVGMNDSSAMNASPNGSSTTMMDNSTMPMGDSSMMMMDNSTMPMGNSSMMMPGNMTQ